MSRDLMPPRQSKPYIVLATMVVVTSISVVILMRRPEDVRIPNEVIAECQERLNVRYFPVRDPLLEGIAPTLEFLQEPSLLDSEQDTIRLTRENKAGVFVVRLTPRKLVVKRRLGYRKHDRGEVFVDRSLPERFQELISLLEDCEYWEHPDLPGGFGGEAFWYLECKIQARYHVARGFAPKSEEWATFRRAVDSLFSQEALFYRQPAR